jgi:hypothetical protein
MNIYNDGAVVKYIVSPSITIVFQITKSGSKKNQIRLIEISNYYRYGAFTRNKQGLIRNAYAPDNLAKYQEIYKIGYETGLHFLLNHPELLRTSGDFKDKQPQKLDESDLKKKKRR